MKTLAMMLLMSVAVFGQNVIDITVKGISDLQNNGAQQDRLEAILDAKRQACEKAGLTIESLTRVENFQTVFDLVETKAATVLLPGFQVVEIGYVQDGTFQVVLSGKIKILEEEENISSKEMRYAKSLNDRGKHSECEAILKKYIDSEDIEMSEELKEESFYYFIKWGYAWNIEESSHKFAAFYPESKYLSSLQSFAAFAGKPLFTRDQTYASGTGDWQPTELQHNEITFTRKIPLAADTIIFTNFKEQPRSLLVNLNLYSEEGKEPRTAYRLVIAYYGGDITTPHPEEGVKVIEDRVSVFRSGSSPTFQHSSSGTGFADFQLKGFQMKGDVPVGKGPFEQNLRFEVYQRSF